MNESAKRILEKMNGKYTTDDLNEIMRILRSDGGCPWDREQTHESIRKNFIEETYEVIEAIDTNDMTLLREELGDVLLQVVFHAQMANEDGDFTFDDVSDEVCRKLIERHPHVFGDIKADTSEKVLENWEAIKKSTKHRDTLKDELESVAKTLPALMRARKIAKKAVEGLGNSGADAEKFSLVEESVKGKEDNERAIGKLLYAIAAYSAANGIDAEKALYDECDMKIKELC